MINKRQNAQAQAICFIVTIILILVVWYWDKNFNIAFGPSYYFFKTGVILSLAALSAWTLIKKKIHPDLFQLYGLIVFFYSWYSTVYIHWTYLYAFYQSFMVLSCLSKGKLSLYFLTSLIGLSLAFHAINSQAIGNHFPNFQSHYVLTTIIFYTISIFSHLLIFRFRTEIDKLNDHFIMMGKRSGLLTLDMKAPLNRLLSRAISVKEASGMTGFIEDIKKIDQVLTSIEYLSGPISEVKTSFHSFSWEEMEQELNNDFKRYLDEMNIDLVLNNFQGNYRGNAALISRLFKSFVANAIESIGFQEVRSIISFTLTTSETQLTIKASYTNSQVPIFSTTRLFDPSYTHPQRTVNRALGFYLMKNIVDAHQGNIQVLEIDNPTTFIISLPL